jgi:hypothetical protein
MTQATILVLRDKKFPVAYVIVATKTSLNLRDALKRFADKFYSQFSPFFAHPSTLDAFAPTAALVKECFHFVPEYD